MLSFLPHLVKNLPKKVLHQSKAFERSVHTKDSFLSIKITLMIIRKEK
jgi:hypothetical protein